MNVILLEDVDKLGEEGEVVSVKNGYGRNYLIPRGLARLATQSAIRAHAEERRQAARKLAQKQENAEELARQLGETEILIPVKVGEENRIFGTVTSQQLAVELSKRGFEIDRKRISIAEDIRVIGVYTAEVKLHSEVSAEVKVRVVPEDQPDAV